MTILSIRSAKLEVDAQDYQSVGSVKNKSAHVLQENRYLVVREQRKSVYIVTTRLLLTKSFDHLGFPRVCAIGPHHESP